MSINLFHSGDDFYESALEDIESANVSIKLEMYKFNLNGIGQKFAHKLIEKAKSGLDIAILVDGVGSKNFGGSLHTKMLASGIKIKIYHPIPWQFHQFKHAVSTLPTIKKMFYLFAKINTRNHRKVIIIDDKILYLGSINISNDHISQTTKPAWSDCAIRLFDSSAAEIATTAFNRAFSPDLKNIYQGFQQTIAVKNNIILNNNLVKRQQNFRRLLKKIKKSQTRIWLVSAYFAPNNTLLKALISAASRGVDVRLILPKSSDIAFMNLAAKYFYGVLLQSNIKIYEHSPTMIHSKYMLIDNWAMVGSSNLNHRSIMHDLEIDFQCTDPDFISKLEQMFILDKTHSNEISNYLYKSNWFARLLFRFVCSFRIVL